MDNAEPERGRAAAEGELPAGSLRGAEMRRSSIKSFSADELAAELHLRSIPTDGLATELLVRARNGDLCEPQLTGDLQMAYELGGDQHGNRFSRRRLRDFFSNTYPFEGCENLELEGATVMEIGCGSENPLALLMVFALLGARRCIGVDLDEPYGGNNRMVRGMARAASYLLLDPRLVVGSYPITREQVAANAAEFDLRQLYWGHPAGVPAGRLQHLRKSLYDLDLPAEVDLTFSVSFLEHIPDVDKAVGVLARITKPGGFGIHGIDGTDHRRYNHPEIGPLQFLCEDTDAALVHGSNRLRPLQFVDVFEAHGFEVLEVRPETPIEVTDELRSSLAERFRSIPEEVLQWGSARIFVRRK